MKDLYKEVPVGENPPQKINVVVDLPQGSPNKYEYDEDGGFFKLDRTLYSPMFYPFEYGFVPQTLSDDDDPLDAMVLTTYSTFPGCVISTRPIGVLYMKDEDGIDNKILTVPDEKVDPRFKEIKKVDDISNHQKKEIELFFSDYKKLEKGKYEHVEVKGWGNKKEAEKIIEKSIKQFKK